MSEFLRMGGYAAYVWPSFALAAVVLAWNVIAARRLLATARERAQGRAIAGQGAP
jgi:heme exporter protein D